MKNTTIILLLLLFFFITLIIPSPSSSQSCKPFCGPLPLHFPFGSGPGCGHPSFNPHITCNPSQQSLLFTTISGTYPITSIDYTNHLIFIQDPSMSTCSTSCSSPGFSLNSNAPFSFSDFSFFALLSCSSSSSIITTTTTLCDNSPICTLLSSCPSLSSSSPSSCCVYTPVTLGPAFQMNLKSMNCNSYTAVYSFNGDETNPAIWKYGIVLKYKFSVDDAYPYSCDSCEQSGGVCGFTISGDSSSSSSSSYRFSCNCNGDMNTTTNCHFPSWSHAVIFSSPSSWTGLICWILSLVWMFMIRF
ncbi:Wall-associated receptor kinase galacturonan-binding domain-containing protein [Dioscorea alata]|uniref:Wall-associated receptor kinase galacturonan-binding domain-containing protein n=1 Tax=Dioscorea alata TaxID=55571 RepID=A0ACB7VN43_DIOAL|nr:Wall-associated receptor kinase galacturonan-binding domain-containing protein [Dioscorea alata]